MSARAYEGWPGGAAQELYAPGTYDPPDGPDPDFAPGAEEVLGAGFGGSGLGGAGSLCGALRVNCESSASFKLTYVVSGAVVALAFFGVAGPV
jgi:hypothetical protein